MQIDSDFVLDAVNTVLSWDLPEEVYADAISTQACHLAGSDADGTWDDDVDRKVH